VLQVDFLSDPYFDQGDAINMTSLELQQSSSRRDGHDEVEDPSGGKTDIDLIESAGHDRAATYGESVAARLPKAHRDYLMERHGTLELDPIPGMGAADPLNWPEWKVSPCLPVKIPREFIEQQLMHPCIENDEFDPCGLPRLHGHIHRRCHHSGVFHHC
jgi:hypothetical protein